MEGDQSLIHTIVTVEIFEIEFENYYLLHFSLPSAQGDYLSMLLTAKKKANFVGAFLDKLAKSSPLAVDANSLRSR